MAKGFMQVATGALRGFNDNAANEYERIAGLDKIRLNQLFQRNAEYEKQHSEYSNKINTANQAGRALIDAGIPPGVVKTARDMWISTGDKKWLEPAFVLENLKQENDPKADHKKDLLEGETAQVMDPRQPAVNRTPPPTAPDPNAILNMGGRTHLNPQQYQMPGRPTPGLDPIDTGQSPYVIKFLSPQMRSKMTQIGLEAMKTVYTMAKEMPSLRDPNAALNMQAQIIKMYTNGAEPPPWLLHDFRNIGQVASAGERAEDRNEAARQRTIQAWTDMYRRQGIDPTEAAQMAVISAASNGQVVGTPDGKMLLKNLLPNELKAQKNMEVAEIYTNAWTAANGGKVPQGADIFQAEVMRGTDPGKFRLMDGAIVRADANARAQTVFEQGQAAGQERINRVQGQVPTVPGATPQAEFDPTGMGVTQPPPTQPPLQNPNEVRRMKDGATPIIQQGPGGPSAVTPPRTGAGGAADAKVLEQQAAEKKIFMTQYGLDETYADLLSKATTGVKTRALDALKGLKPSEVSLATKRVDQAVNILFRGGTNSSGKLGTMPDGSLDIVSMSPEFQEALSTVRTVAISQALEAVKASGNAASVEKLVQDVFNREREQAFKRKLISMAVEAEKAAKTQRGKAAADIFEEMARAYVEELSPGGAEAFRKVKASGR